VDTAFECSRLNIVTAFPNSGHAPFTLSWDAFRAYFEKMAAFGIVESMKDFYWDIRPKPEYGTVEVRVCDTPLDVELAAALAAYAQALARHVRTVDRSPPSEEIYLVYQYNRFQACRFGLEGTLTDPVTRQHHLLRDDVLHTLELVEPQAEALQSGPALRSLKERVLSREWGSTWLRHALLRTGTLPDVVRVSAERWMGR
jgi:carboxylate-amine ligase